MLSSPATAAVLHSSSLRSAALRAGGAQLSEEQQLQRPEGEAAAQQQSHARSQGTAAGGGAAGNAGSFSPASGSTSSFSAAGGAPAASSTARLTPEQLAAVALPTLPTAREVSAAGVLLLLQEIVGYATRRSSGNKEDAIALLDSQGFCVGVRLLERLALRSQQRIIEQRECLKFVCKDLWQLLFQKQADRLQTNRRGGYVIQDHSLPWLRRLSPAPPTAAPPPPPSLAFGGRAAAGAAAGASYSGEGSGPTAAAEAVAGAAARALWMRGGGPVDEEEEQFEGRKRADGRDEEDETAAAAAASAAALLLQQQQQQEAAAAALCHQPAVHVALLCGIIRGALAGMGLTCTVSAETSSSPYCSFQVRIPPS